MRVSKKWILESLVVVLSDTKMIDWGNGLMTPVSDFNEMFGEVIERAINENKDVRKAIAENDNGRGYSNLILN